ncbi:hypothetical protein [Streptomyces sp. NPDC060322]|uniref:hypothetical protein n=1 Tax=Streptomyces sp. NPDC060322 TaxID=3347097 RepID=UPI003661B78E
MVGEARRLTDDDFFTAGTEDRYLDVFRLAPDETSGGREVREELARTLNGLPRHGRTLGHDVKANADFLTELTA